MAGIDCQRMAQKHVIIHLSTHTIGFPVVLGVDIHTVVDADHQVLLIDHLPVFYTVSEGLVADTGVTLKGKGAVPALPAIVLLNQCVRQVKMIQSYEGLDALFKQVVDHTVIEIDALLVHLAISVRNNASPGEGETVCFHTHLLHQVDIFLPVVIEIAGHLTVRLLIGTFKRIIVCYGHAFAIFVPAAFDLKCRGGSAPEKIFRKICHNFGSFRKL